MNAWRLIARNGRAASRYWSVFLSGFAEPVLYLLSIGVGVGAMIGGFQVDGRTVGYAAFVAPAMLATSAMNGAVMDSTFNVFFRLRYTKLYDAILATPLTTRDVALGETGWSLLRGGVYSAAFLVLMTALGLTKSWWAVLALPATLVIGFAFAGVGMALTTYMRTWQDFEYVTLALTPMVLFSGTFFPVEALGPVWRWVVELTPLYRGVVLCRELTLGTPGVAAVVSVVYLAAGGTVGMLAAARRVDRLLRA